VLSREYHPWDRQHLILDTALRTVEENVNTVREALHRASLEGPR
jgi:hypothetical protein